MTFEEISRIKEHIEIHARREPGAIKITEIMWKAVDELEHIAELQEENAELKEEVKNNEDLATVAYMQGAESQKKKADKQVAKAKEIIKKFSEFVNNEVEYDPEHPQEHTDLWNELCGQAEQFLKEVERNDR